MTHKFFSWNFLCLLGVFCILFASFIFYYDPLIVTGFMSKANPIVPDIDARLQKTNRLLCYHADYDALLIGSSRVEQFQQEDFAPIKIFNYAMPSIYPNEYTAYIDLFLKTNRNHSPIIFLGFDFYGSNSIRHAQQKEPDYYIGNSSPFLRATRLLLSTDSFKLARKMSTGSFKKEIFEFRI